MVIRNGRAHIRIRSADSLADLCNGRATTKTLFPRSIRFNEEALTQLETEEAVRLVRDGHSVRRVCSLMASVQRDEKWWHKVLIDIAMKGELYRPRKR